MTPHQDRYGEWLRDHDLSPNTIGQRLSFLSRVVEEFDPTTVTAGDLSDWLSQFSGWTRRAYVYSLRSVMRFMVDTGQRADDPTVTLRVNPSPDVNPRPLTAAEERRLLARATGDEHAWVVLGLRAGLRCHETAKIAGEDVARDRIRILGKHGKVAWVPTHPDVWELAQRYPREGVWFPSYGSRGHVTSKWVSARTSVLLQEIGADGSYHRLRATYATTLLREGANIKIVQKLMRHGSLASTEHYVDAAEDELTAAIQTLGRRAA
jgi:site-specific recombinase XerD